mmetsp:Transcript_54160/g.139892  ORF Transcript_54160/g.139892 Transcript_54160/m.139892 type:complete len:85 (+) Transcript_54160:970-1224(+)
MRRDGVVMALYNQWQQCMRIFDQTWARFFGIHDREVDPDANDCLPARTCKQAATATCAERVSCRSIRYQSQEQVLWKPVSSNSG